MLRNAAALLSVLVVSSLVAAPLAAQERLWAEPVTDGDLAAVPARDWLSFRGHLASWGYSSLDQINRSNVGHLAIVWSVTMEAGPNEAGPIVRDGVMYLPNSGDVIQALDATTGDLIWEYRREWPEDIRSRRSLTNLAAPVNRSVAVYGDAIFATTGDAYVIRLDAHTGELEWETEVGQYGYVSHTTGPIIADGKVISGRSCDTALPGGCYITAHDAEDGRELWRFYTIPRPGNPGFDTWGDLPFENRIHVGAWFIGSYDPELDLIYWGTSVPAPSPEVLRGTGDGELLYSNSTVALEPETGELRWYFQHLPRDNWDLDHPFERMLVDLEVEPDAEETWVRNPNIEPGEKRKLVTGVPGKNGLVWTLDRETGEFLWARPTVFQNVVDSIDPKTGHVTVNTDVIPRSFEDDYGVVCPSASGGRNWPAAAYSPRTSAMYVPLQNLCMTMEMTTPNPGPQDFYAFSGRGQFAPGKDTLGRLQAISARTGKTDWQYEHQAGMMSTMTTGGDLVFAGDTNRRFRALDAETGEVLWENVLNGPVTGYPASYSVDGEQYVTVAVGGGDLLSGGFNRFSGRRVRSGSNVLYAFKLPASARLDVASGGDVSAPRLARSTAPETSSPAAAAEAELPGRLDGTTTPCFAFTEAQVERGRSAYVRDCAQCHGDSLRGGNHGTALAGPTFERRWQARPASALVHSIRETMPPGAENTIGASAARGMVAYILSAAGRSTVPTVRGPAAGVDTSRLCFANADD